MRLITGKIYDWADIVMALDERAKILIKEFRPDGDELFNRLIFHEQTYFKGFTIEHIKNTMKFSVVDNHYSQKEAERMMKIRSLEAEIESLEQNIWSWKFDFGDDAPIPNLEEQLKSKKQELLNVIKAKSAA
jgi:hypothetical protein